VIVKGANDLLSEKDISDAEEIISKAKVLVCQLEISPQISLAAMQLAKKHNGKFYNFLNQKRFDVHILVATILNPAPAVCNLDSQFYAVCDYFCPNETEVGILPEVLCTCSLGHYKMK
jgi:ribokinase